MAPLAVLSEGFFCQLPCFASPSTDVWETEPNHCCQGHDKSCASSRVVTVCVDISVLLHFLDNITEFIPH